MKKKSFLVNLLIFSTILTNQVIAKPRYLNLDQNYIGINTTINKIDMQPEYGGNMFPKLTQAISLYMGTSLAKNFGVEAGFESHFKKTRNTLLSVGEIMFTDVLGAPVHSEIKLKHRHSLYVGLNLKLNITENNYFKATVGLAKTKLKYFLLIIDTTTNLAEVNQPLYINKIIPTLKFSITQQINNNLSLETLLSWINTKKFPSKYDNTLRFSNSSSLGLGLIYNF